MSLLDPSIPTLKHLVAQFNESELVADASVCVTFRTIPGYHKESKRNFELNFSTDMIKVNTVVYLLKQNYIVNEDLVGSIQLLPKLNAKFSLYNYKFISILNGHKEILRLINTDNNVQSSYKELGCYIDIAGIKKLLESRLRLKQAERIQMLTMVGLFAIGIFGLVKYLKKN